MAKEEFIQRAAIAAMQASISLLGSSNQAFYDVLVENFKGTTKTYPKEIAQFAVACADALFEELTSKFID